MNRRHLVYITNMRMPTEKAHGIQVMRMCDAFAGLGWRVSLVYPFRFQTNRRLRRVSPFVYYGLQNTFELVRVPHLDLLPLERWLGRRPLRPFYIVTNSMFAWLAARRARSLAADLYYTREWLVASWLVRWGLPTVLEVHQSSGWAFTERARRVVRAMGGHAALRAVVTISHGLQEELSRMGVPRDKIHVLPDAVDLGRYEPHLRRDQARRYTVLPQRGRIVMYTGHLFPGKGVETLIEAGRFLDGVIIAVVGGTERDLNRVRDYIYRRNLDGIVLLGHVPPHQVPRYQQAADVLVHPQRSLDAQSPLKLYEYMAARRPIVATDLAPIREVLEHEKTALLVPPNDPEAMAGAIRRLLQEPSLARRLVRNAFEQARAWTWEKRAAQVLERISVPERS